MGSRNHHHQRPQVAKTNRGKLQNGQQSTGVHCRNFRYKNKELILPLYKSLVLPHLEHAVQFWSPHLRRDIDKMEKIQRRTTKMIPEIRNISLVQRRLRGQLIEVFKNLNRFTTASARGLFDYDLNDRTRNNGVKLIVKHFNTSVAQHFYPMKITTTRNALPNEVVTSRTVNSFRIAWTNTGQKIPQMSELTGSNHRCRAKFKCAQTVVDQRFAGNGPNGLSYYLLLLLH